MPWYKVFDETTKSWDGVVRYNNDPNRAAWFPNWVTNGEDPTEATEQIEKAYQMGPYYTT